MRSSPTRSLNVLRPFPAQGVPSEFERRCWWEFRTEHEFHAEKLTRVLSLTRGTDFEF